MDVGTRLGHYEIIDRLGAGGMGEVYRARDLELGRLVALKFLRPDLPSDGQYLARLRREAQLLAGLEHPRIARLYSFEEVDGSRFLAMEFVDGETLADRLQRGALPVPKALLICAQIAEGLDAAHLAGVVHRDLKPSNVLLDSDGDVHLADFGVARSIELTADVRTAAPTSADNLTRTGVQVGTAPYMSPEQVRGKPVDGRADVWALGCTLYECLTGSRPFDSPSVADTMSAILNEEPDWSRLPQDTPARIRRLLERMLEKDPRDRQRSAGDVWLEIRESVTDGAATRPQAVKHRGSNWIPWALAATLSAVLLAVALWPNPDDSPSTSGRVSFALPRDLDLGATSTHNIAISPDGTHIAYRAFHQGSRTSRLYVQRMNELDAVEVPGAIRPYTPIFSPDSRRLAFGTSSGDRGDLWTFSLDGGEPTLICEVCESRGLTWGDDGFIYFATVFTGLYRVPESGGEPELVISMDVRNPDVDSVVRFPNFVLGKNAIVYTADREGGRPDDGYVELLSLDDMSRRTLIERAVDARVVPSGHLVFSRSPNLMAAPFDLNRLEIVGEAVALPDSPETNWTNRGEAHWRSSDNGLFVYEPARPAEETEIIRVDTGGDGELTPVGAPFGAYGSVSATRDGSIIAVGVIEPRRWWIGLYDVARHSLQRIDLEVDAYAPLLSPDGRMLAYSTQHTGGHSLWIRSVTGAYEPRRIREQSPYIYVRGWIGESLVVQTQIPPRPGVSLVILDTATGEFEPLVDTDVDDTLGSVSPDGNWLAYNSGGSVFVQAYPSGKAPVQLTSGGSGTAVWAASGRALFIYQDGALDIVDVPAQPGNSFGTPRRLFALDVRGGRLGNRFAAVEGDQLIGIRTTSPPPPNDRLVLVLDWFDQLREFAPRH